MKPAQFQYRAPHSLRDALGLIGDEARPLAGGQSLVPMLNFRLATPALLVDLNGIAELSHLRELDGVLRIGALTRQAALERSELVRRGWPLLRHAVRMVAHPAIRSRGTVGGSVAHADPAAELPAALLALDARVRVQSLARGERTVPVSELFLGPLTTSLEADELLTEIEVPSTSGGARSAFAEYARTHGDFALAGAAVVLAPGEHAAIALLGVGPIPVRAPVAEEALVAGAGGAEAASLAGEGIEDEYRRALVAAVVAQAISQLVP